jgi:hypothetical protein
MDIKVTSTSVALVDVDAFTSLRVVVDRDVTTTALEHIVGTYGRLAGDTHAFFMPDAIERLPGGRPADTAWREALGKMCAYAVSKGWSDETGAIQAHIERG